MKQNFKSFIKGFTLMEMLVVIVLIGILAAVALPRFLGSSNDAKRAINYATVATLNAAAAAAISNARIPGALVSVGSLTAAPANYSGTTANILNIDNNTTITTNNYLGFNSTGTVPIGGAKGVYANPPVAATITTSALLSYADLTGTTYATGCNNLFNVLMGDNSVQSQGTVVGSSTAAYLTAPAGTGTVKTINGIAVATFITAAMQTSNSSWGSDRFTPIKLTGTGGGCVYFLNSSTSIVFYIIYDAISGIFYESEWW